MERYRQFGVSPSGWGGLGNTNENLFHCQSRERVCGAGGRKQRLESRKQAQGGEARRRRGGIAQFTGGGGGSADRDQSPVIDPADPRAHI